MMGRSSLAGLMAAAAALTFASPAGARIETLRWLQPESTAAVSGFSVHYGTAPGIYGDTVDVGSSVPDASGLYEYDLTVGDTESVYIAMSSRSVAGESQLSNEIFRPAPASDPSAGTSGGASAADVASAAGVDSLQLDIAGSPPTDEAVYTTGGAAAGDYDDDGWVDLYVTRLDTTDLLFRNRGDGTFEDATQAAGLTSNLPSNGAAFGDVDNDGDLDLYVTTLGAGAGRFHLYVNDGRGGFSEDAVARGAALDGTGPHAGQSVAFGDFDLDGWLDVHTSGWSHDGSGGPANPTSRLLRNRGAAAPGHFDDVTQAAGVAVQAGVAVHSSRFSDLDGDGWPELLVIADGGESRLFWNDGDGSFTDGTLDAGVGTDENGVGSAVGDVDGNGLLDWFVTGIYDPDDVCADPLAGCSFAGSGNRLYMNGGGRQFQDATDQAGVRDGYWGTSAALYDIDNDADLDLAMANGANFPHLEPPDDTPYARFDPDPLVVWRNDATSMAEVAADLGMADLGAGRGIVTLDYDADGDLDLFVANNAGVSALYRNDAPAANGWLRVRTLGVDSNRAGVGAVVRVWTTATSEMQVREIDAGSHYLGQSEAIAHFGLGPGSGPVHRVEVSWPATGRTQSFTDVARDFELLAVEPAATAAATDPAPATAAPAVATASGSGSSGGGSACGLLGVEPFVVLALAARRRRERGSALRR